MRILASVGATVLGLAVQIPAFAAKLPERAERIAVEIGIFYAPLPKGNAESVLGTTLKAHPKWTSLAKVPKTFPDQPTVIHYLDQDPASDYRPPDVDALGYFGRGLDEQQAKAVQGTRQVLILHLLLTAPHLLEDLKDGYALAAEVAQATDGFVWDQGARLLYTPDQCKERLVDRWTGRYPDMGDQVVIHSYREGADVRSITLGMEKLGLPDLVVERSPWSLNDQVTNLIDLVAQAMIEGHDSDANGRLRLDPAALVTLPALTHLHSEHPGVVTVTLRPGVKEEGDADNDLVEIGFDAYPGADESTRQKALLTALYGPLADEQVLVRHDDGPLAEASRRARAGLPALRKRFQAGLGPGDFIRLKWPFPVKGGGREYMWVYVNEWRNDGTIIGQLDNAPDFIPELKAGQKVTIDEAQVFDWLLTRKDGTSEGGETNEIVQKMPHEQGRPSGP